MTIKYTKEQLNKFDKDLLIELFLGMQGQMEELSRQTQALNDRMQLMMEQIVLSNKSSQKEKTDSAKRMKTASRCHIQMLPLCA